jgi:fused signal recognition particle receptor
LFGFIKDKLTKIYDGVTKGLSSLFANSKLDDEFLSELKKLLIKADVGVAATKTIIDDLQEKIDGKTIDSMEAAREALGKHLKDLLVLDEALEAVPRVLMLVGVNGSGKTSFAGKFAALLKDRGKKVLLVAADTFRAAATEQLVEWGSKVGCPVHTQNGKQDAAAVVFDACREFVAGGFDHLIIDTAGRLQAKEHLMRELEKVRRIVGKQMPDEDVRTWLTIDAMLGQNSLEQARVFNEATKLDALVLTKMDGTGKGGAVFAISSELKLPVSYMAFGEQLSDIAPFDPDDYVKGILDA